MSNFDLSFEEELQDKIIKLENEIDKIIQEKNEKIEYFNILLEEQAKQIKKKDKMIRKLAGRIDECLPNDDNCFKITVNNDICTDCIIKWAENEVGNED